MEDYYIIMVNTEGLAQCALIADELTARIVHSSLLLRIDKSSLGVSRIGVATKALIGSVRVGSVHEELHPDPNST